jgi:hypothetical protein
LKVEKKVRDSPEVTVDVGVLVTGVDGVSAGEDGSSLVVVEEPEPGGRVVVEEPEGELGLAGGLPVVEEDLVLVVVELEVSSSSPLLVGGGVFVEVDVGVDILEQTYQISTGQLYTLFAKNVRSRRVRTCESRWWSGRSVRVVSWSVICWRKG